MGGKVESRTPEIKPGERFASASADTLFSATRGLYVGGGGSLRVMDYQSTVVSFTSVVGGVIYPIKVIQVLSSGTTATNLIALR